MFTASAFPFPSLDTPSSFPVLPGLPSLLEFWPMYHSFQLVWSVVLGKRKPTVPSPPRQSLQPIPSTKLFHGQVGARGLSLYARYPLKLRVRGREGGTQKMSED